MKRGLGVRVAAVATAVVGASGLLLGAGTAQAATGEEIFNETNIVRSENNLPPFTYDGELADSAQSWAEKMERTGKFEHSGRSDVAENIYRSTGNGLSGKEIVDGWMASKGHRENIMNPDYSRLGAGVTDTENGTYAVQ